MTGASHTTDGTVVDDLREGARHVLCLSGEVVGQVNGWQSIKGKSIGLAPAHFTCERSSSKLAKRWIGVCPVESPSELINVNDY
jgi:hypothetical protein